MTRAGTVGILVLFAALASADEQLPKAEFFDSGSDRLPLETVIPHYPHDARRDRIEGEVQVCFEVTRSGRTRRVAVRTSSHRAFEKPAIKAVRASSFRPLADDEPLPPTKLCRTFVFALEPVAKQDLSE